MGLEQKTEQCGQALNGSQIDGFDFSSFSIRAIVKMSEDLIFIFKFHANFELKDELDWKGNIWWMACEQYRFRRARELDKEKGDGEK